jgi:hypothetical protein
MQEHNGPAPSHDDSRAEPDEVAEVLAGLRALMARATIPVVRACLEDAHDDIAHLAGQGDLATGLADGG